VKRGFLFGLGCFLALAAVAAVIRVLTHGGLAWIIISFVAAPLSALTIRRATFAPIGPRLPTVIGWLFGFFVIDAAFLVAIGIALLVPQFVR
jgi:hypothetical protein